MERGGARVGKCMLMCPEKERTRREKQKQLSVFEIDHSARDRHKSSPGLAVKEYIRAGAGQQVPDLHDLRPPAVLMKTIDHLMKNVIDREDHPWHTVYHFLDNRVQAIRLDITYQQLEGPEVVYIHELASRFYLYAQYRLLAAGVDRFDPKLNRDHLQQCLLKLLKLYTNQVGGLPPNIAEFESYYLLTNLGSSEAITHALELKEQIRHAPAVQLALSLSLHFLQNNFVRVFKLTDRLSPLGKCALYPHINTIRRQALQTLCTAYSTRNAHFPLRVLCRWLLWDDLETTSEFCKAHEQPGNETSSHSDENCTGINVHWTAGQLNLEIRLEVSGDGVLFRRGGFKPLPHAQGLASPFTIAGIITEDLKDPKAKEKQTRPSDLIIGLKSPSFTDTQYMS